MESPDTIFIIFIFVGALVFLCTAAALPRSLLTVAFFALVATVAVVVLFEVAPTSRADNASVVDIIKPRHFADRDRPN